MKEVEHGLASNIEKDVEVEARCTESQTSPLEVPLQTRQLAPHCIENGGNSTRKTCLIGCIFHIGLLGWGGKLPNMKNVPNWMHFHIGLLGWGGKAT